MPVSLPQINVRIRAEVSKHMELVRGSGYHYFTYDDKALGRYEEHSIMVPYTSHQSVEQWLADAREALVKFQGYFDEQDAYRAARAAEARDITALGETLNKAALEPAERVQDAVRPKEVFALIPYSDGSGPRLKVADGYVLEGEQHLCVEAVGSIQVGRADLDTLIAALQAAKRFYEMED